MTTEVEASNGCGVNATDDAAVALEVDIVVEGDPTGSLEQEQQQQPQQRSVRQRLSRQERRRQKKLERRRRQLREAKSFCKKFVAFIFSHLGLSGLIVAYTFVGGLIFRAIEMPEEQLVKIEASRFRLRVTEQLVVQQAAELCPIEFNASSPASAVAGCAEGLIRRLREAANQTVSGIIANVTWLVKEKGWNGSFDEEEFTWNFAGALLFVVTVITTIGYGHAAPKSQLGMICTIVCAFFGIPLMFLYLNNIGDYLADGFRLLYTNLCRPYFKRFRLCEAKAKSETATGGDQNGSQAAAAKLALDMIRVKKRFAQPLLPQCHPSGVVGGVARSSEDTGFGAGVNKSDSLPAGLRLSSFDSPELDPEDPRARRAYVTSRLLPAKPISPMRPRRAIRRSVSTPQQGLHSALAAESKETPSEAPIVDWRCLGVPADGSGVVSAATTPTSAEAPPLNAKEAAEEDAKYLKPQRISYISLDAGDSNSDDSSCVSSSTSGMEDEPANPERRLSRSSNGILIGAGNSSRRVSSNKLRRRLRHVTVPLSLSIAVMIGYVVLGAFMFTIWETADYIKWSYFCFITLSTIGFGDIVPGTEVNSQNPKEKLIATTLYVAIGLSVFAMCFKLMQEEVVQKVRRLGRRLGIVPADPAVAAAAAAAAASAASSAAAARRAEARRRRRRRLRRLQRRRMEATDTAVAAATPTTVLSVKFSNDQ